jgi:hypothetical protein
MLPDHFAMNNSELYSNADHDEKAHEKTKCALLSSFHHFEIPDHLLDQLKIGNVVIFAGAGISTETSTAFRCTFYDEIHAELRLDPKNRPPFPELMSMFCKRPDGRRELLEELRSRFQYIAAFPELLRAATRFHQDISTLFYIDTYITTNWDDYFEKYCGAIPFVTAEDFAFWNVKGRKVFKIHGSVSNYGSIVATTEDYRRVRTQLERGALGSALKLLLATKTIVYVGYSFSDHDFLSIQRYIARELRSVTPVAYIVSLDKLAESRFRKLGLTPIFTDAGYFIHVLKKRLENDKGLLPDSRLDGIWRILARVNKEHKRLFNKFKIRRKPEIIYSAAYQDGLSHAFGRMLAMAHTGQYSNGYELANQLREYDKIYKDNIRRRRYEDVAYIQGYINGLIYLILDDKQRSKIPLYFGFGMPELRTFHQYKKALGKRRGRHKASLALAKHIVFKGLGPNDLFHHTPFIDWKD